MQKLSILSRSLSKIKHKRYELYVLSRILHLLNDPGIKFNFQQYAHRVGDKFALIDLYLPQFNIAIEVDEVYHKTQLTADEIRQREIENNIEPQDVIRIDCSEGIVDVNNQISKCVNNIKAAKEIAEQEGRYEAWDGLSGYEHYRQKGVLSLKDNQELSSPTEICNIFGILNAPQRGSTVWYRDKDESYRIWWPRENYEDANGNISGDWYNKMTGDKIEEYCLKPGNGNGHNPRQEHLDKVIKENRPRIVFYAKRNMLNERLYRYVGVFELDVEESRKEGKCVWKRNDDLSDAFKLPELPEVEETVAMESLKKELTDVLSMLGQIKERVDGWRTCFNANNLDQIKGEISNLKNEESIRGTKRLLSMLDKLNDYISSYMEAEQSTCEVSVDYNDESSDSRDKILTQINKVYEVWCKNKSKITLLKPHLIPLYEIKDDQEKYDDYIKNEILQEWIRHQSLCKSDLKQKRLAKAKKLS